MSRATPSGTTVTERQAARATAPAQEADVQELFVGDREYAQAFGEDLARTLDVDTWATGIDWEGAVARRGARSKPPCTAKSVSARRCAARYCPRSAKQRERPRRRASTWPSPTSLRRSTRASCSPDRLRLSTALRSPTTRCPSASRRSASRW